MSVLSLKSRLHGIDNDAKNIVRQGLLNGQQMSLNDAFDIDKYVRNLKQNDAWKNISFFRDFANVPNLNPSGGPRITFTRASSATRVNQQGLITTAAINEARFDYDPVTKVGKGLLIEEARTNSLLRSEEFDNASWTKTRCVITANAIISPDGTLSADKLVETATSSDHNTNQGVSISPQQTLTYSLFVKTAERTQIQLRMQETSVGNVVNCIFDLNTLGVTATNVGTGSGAVGSITSFGNGWYRCVLSGRPSASTGTSTQCPIALCVGGTDSYTGDGTSGLYIWGAQLEVGSFATSYIPTTSATVTRAADLCASNDVSTWSNLDQGSFFSEWIHGGGQVVFAIGNGTDYRAIRTPSNFTFTIRETGQPSGDLIISGSTPVAGAKYKMVVSYSAGSAAGSVNGGATVTSSPIAFPRVNGAFIGSLSNGALWLNGHIGKIIYWSRRLSNSDLPSLTS